jgi:hypothetical protein
MCLRFTPFTPILELLVIFGINLEGVYHELYT